MTKIDTADLQAFILHLNDETRWPSKYYKAVIRYCIAKAVHPDLEPPEEIHYSRCVKEYGKETR